MVSHYDSVKKNKQSKTKQENYLVQQIEVTQGRIQDFKIEGAQKLSSADH